MKIQSYTFFKVNGKYEYVIGNLIKTLSDEMMACVDRQFILMGFHKREIGCSICYGKIEEIEENA